MDHTHDKPRVVRSRRWPKARLEHLKLFPKCAACGAKEHLEVHHVKPVHAYPELELVQTNLITLCDGPGKSCHLTFGHLGSWYSWNVTIVDDAAGYLLRVTMRPRAFEPRGLFHDELTKGLSANERAVLMMRYADGLSDDEMAEVTGLPAATLRFVHDTAVAVIRTKAATQRSREVNNQVFTTGQVAALLKCAPRTVARMIEHGQIVAYRLKSSPGKLGDRRITFAALDAYCRANDIQIEMPYGLPTDPPDPPATSAAAA